MPDLFRLKFEKETFEDDSSIDAGKQRAVTILIVRGDINSPEVLAVSRRDDHSAFGLPGGKVEKDESRIAAARRELKEETGLDAMVFDPVFKRVDEDFVVTTFFVDHYYGIPGSRLGEGVVAWVKPRVLADGPFGQFNRKLFETVGIPF